MWDIGISVLVDGGEPAELIEWLSHPGVRGATTNPSLLRESGRTNQELLRLLAPHLAGRPISLYPVADTPGQFLGIAAELSSIYSNVFVKVPVVDRHGGLNDSLLARVAVAGHHVNVTAVHTARHALLAEECTRAAPRRILSVFAGRLADSGRDPVLDVGTICRSLRGRAHLDVLWASTRQVFDVELARRAGCDLITVPAALLRRAETWGTDLDALAVQAVRQFERAAAGDRVSASRTPSRIRSERE